MRSNSRASDERTSPCHIHVWVSGSLMLPHPLNLTPFLCMPTYTENQPTIFSNPKIHTHNSHTHREPPTPHPTHTHTHTDKDRDSHIAYTHTHTHTHTQTYTHTHTHTYKHTQTQINIHISSHRQARICSCF